MKKVLVIGAAGMAGHLVYTYLSSTGQYDMLSACHGRKLNSGSMILDVRDQAAVKKILETVRPDIVINCTGILVGGSQKCPENSIYVNAFFPHMLSRTLHEIRPGASGIHISTACVFSGKKGHYREDDTKDALDVYGMTKNLGEIINKQDLTIRTSIIGPELKENGEGLFHWLFLQRQTGEADGYEKSIWGGVTTLELAKAADVLIRNRISGIYQLSNGTGISKYDLLKLLVSEFSLDIEIKKTDGKDTDKSLVPTEKEGLNYTVPGYGQMIRELKKFMYGHSEYYGFYLEHK